MPTHPIDAPTPPSSAVRMGWLLGHQTAVRRAVKDVLSAILTYVVASILLLIGCIHDVFSVEVAASMFGYFVLCWGSFYALTRSGWSQRLHDPHLTYARVLVDMSSMIMAYALIPMTRGATLQILCAMLAFYMGRLNQKQILTTSFVAVIWMMLTLFGLWHWQPHQIDLSVEILNLLMCSVLLPMAGFVGGEVYRIHQSVARRRDQLQGTLQTLKDLSNKDALTGLANRRHAQQLLEEECRRQDRHGNPFSMAMLDIDFFKAINDTHGHATGDDVLKTFAKLALSTLGPTDTLARWGGEEFMLLMPHTDASQAQANIERIHETMRQYHWSQLSHPLSFSAGLAQHAHLEAPDALIKRCDEALYRAKSSGRNRSEQAAPAERVSVTSLRASTPRAQPTSPILHAPTERSALAKTDHLEASVGSEQSGSWLTRARQLWARRRTRMIIVAFTGMLFWVGMLHFYAIPNGLIAASAAYGLMAYHLIVAFTCHVLTRAGVTRHWRDPHLTLVQLINLCLIGVVCYVLAPALRAVILQSMCVALIFGMVSLNPRQNQILGLTVIALMVGALMSELFTPLGQAAPASEILKTALASCVFLQIAIFAYTASRLREAVVQEHENLSEAVAHVHGLVTHDALTGLYHRSYLMEHIELERQRFQRSQKSFCIAMIDLDHFKQINDEYGHHVGDDVLMSFAQAARQVLRDTDLIARWGGEEFLILFPDALGTHETLHALDRLQDALKTTVASHDEPDLRVSFSAGYAIWQPDETIEHLLHRADLALYEAKRRGRQCAVAASAHC